MAQKRAKKALDTSKTHTFTETQFVKMLDEFLEDEGACDGDWKDKAMAKFLGHESYEVTLKLKVPATESVVVTAANAEEAKIKAAEKLKGLVVDDDDYIFDETDKSEFEVVGADAKKKCQ